MKRIDKDTHKIRRTAKKFQRAEVDKHTILMSKKNGTFVEYTKVNVK